jgi:hypothetical protein
MGWRLIWIAGRARNDKKISNLTCKYMMHSSIRIFGQQLKMIDLQISVDNTLD